MEPCLGRVIGVGGKVEQGSTHPIYGSVHIDGRRERVLLKMALFKPKVPVEAVLNEWMATKLAEAASLQVAPGWLATISEEVAEHIETTFNVGLASRIAFATRDSEIDALLVPDGLDSVSPQDRVLLFGLDMLLLNSDRVPENPNCGKANGRLFAYDFGSALPSRGTHPRSFERCFYPPNLTDRAANHLCRSYVRDAEEMRHTLHQAHRLLTQASPELLASLEMALPEHAVHCALLRSYLGFLKSNEDATIAQIVNTIE